MTFQNLLCELYVHNLAVPDNTTWDSLMYVGDVQFRAVMSWVQNEISQEAQAGPYRNKEIDEPLYLQPEIQDTCQAYFDQISITNNAKCASKITQIHEQEFVEWECHYSRLIPEAIGTCTQKWNSLPFDLKVRQFHSPQNLELVAHRMTRYITLGRSQKNKWIPLRFQPPILLHPMLSRL